MDKMTTELEQEFFKVFEIEPQKLCFNGDCIAKDEIGYDEKICDNRCAYIEREYPKITDRRLLQMICILNETSCEVLSAEDKEDLKNEILETCIKVYNTPILTSDGDEYDNYAIYDKIQQLFKEEQ